MMAKKLAGFTLAWLLLSAVVNLRFPGDETKFSYLWPSLDVTLLGGVYALLALRGRPSPRWLKPLLVALFLMVRFIRFGDGIQRNYFHRPFNLYLDLPLVPEMVRLFWSTSSHAAFALGLVAFVLALLALACAALGARPNGSVHAGAGSALALRGGGAAVGSGIAVRTPRAR
jgi:hypothetical protein